MKLSFFIKVWVLLLFGTIALVVISELASPAFQNSLFREGAAVEMLSAVAYFLAAALLLIQAIMKMPARWTLCALILCFGMRELDFDKRFTTMGIFKLRFFSSNEVLWPEKLLGVVVVALFLALIYLLIKNYSRPFLKKIKQGNGMALSVLFSGGALVVAKTIDGIARKLKPFGIESTKELKHLSSSIEESLELTAALLILILVMAAFRRSEPDPLNSKPA
jgi:hypothetical protein